MPSPGTSAAPAEVAARRLLGGAAPDGRDAGLEALVRALARRLAQAGDERAVAEQRAHERDVEAIRRRRAEPAAALARVRGAVARLRGLTSPGEILVAAAAELYDASQFERVIVSSVRDGTMIAEAVHLRDGDAGAGTALAALRARPLRLEHPILEAELVRRPRAAIVEEARDDPRVDQTMASIMGWRTYAAAPIAVRGSVVGLLHADRGAGAPLEPADCDVLWAFAGGLAEVYETASLRRALRRERERMRSLLDWLGQRSRELSEAPVELVPRAPSSAPPPEADGGGAPLGPGDLTGLLTHREAEILALLAEGRTNQAIADELVVSAGTVKFHVASILRKLHVANRAEAVSRYFALLGMGPRPQ
jgi:DNA-binding CsgD family transcriptional regulator